MIMSEGFLEFLFYLFGFIGLGAIGLLPYRSWQLLQVFLGRKSQRPSQMALRILALAIVLVGFWLDLEIIKRTYECLNRGYCGPNRTGGMYYLAIFGVLYLLFEIVGQLIRWIDQAIGRKT